VSISAVPYHKPHDTLLQDVTHLFMHVPTEQPKTFRPKIIIIIIKVKFTL